MHPFILNDALSKLSRGFEFPENVESRTMKVIGLKNPRVAQRDQDDQDDQGDQTVRIPPSIASPDEMTLHSVMVSSRIETIPGARGDPPDGSTHTSPDTLRIPLS